MTRRVLCVVFSLLIFRSIVNAAGYPVPVEGDLTIKNYEFESAETLPVLRLHYRTLGTPVRDEKGIVRNAVLILHGTGGAGTQFLTERFAGVLFGPGQLLDATKYFIILPDNVGHGQSSKPSDGLHARFPHYGYHDMVVLQHRLLTEGLGVNHLRLVMGTSMGGMHTWMWGEMYPDFMDALMPLASLPVQIAGRNRMTRRMVIDSIRFDPEWKMGEYKTQPRGLTSAIYTLIFMTSAPRYWQQQAPTIQDADKMFDELVQLRLSHADANDMLYQFEASRDYDPSPQLESIQAPLVAINSADDQVNPPELGIMEEQIQRVKRGRFILIPISDKTRGHGTHSLPEVWKNHLEVLLEESGKKGESEGANSKIQSACGGQNPNKTQNPIRRRRTNSKQNPDSKRQVSFHGRIPRAELQSALKNLNFKYRGIQLRSSRRLVRVGLATGFWIWSVVMV